MLYYIIFIEFSMIYTSSLYFVSHHLFQGRLKKKKKLILCLQTGGYFGKNKIFL